jgi:hypothetical protein
VDLTIKVINMCTIKYRLMRGCRYNLVTKSCMKPTYLHDDSVFMMCINRGERNFCRQLVLSAWLRGSLR